MLVARRGANENEQPTSPYLLCEPRILRDACQEMGRDDGGRHCRVCCVRELCESQARRAGRLIAADQLD